MKKRVSNQTPDARLLNREAYLPHLLFIPISPFKKLSVALSFNIAHTDRR